MLIFSVQLIHSLLFASLQVALLSRLSFMHETLLGRHGWQQWLSPSVVPSRLEHRLFIVEFSQNIIVALYSMGYHWQCEIAFRYVNCYVWWPASPGMLYGSWGCGHLLDHPWNINVKSLQSAQLWKFKPWKFPLCGSLTCFSLKVVHDNLAYMWGTLSSAISSMEFRESKHPPQSPATSYIHAIQSSYTSYTAGHL